MYVRILNEVQMHASHTCRRLICRRSSACHSTSVSSSSSVLLPCIVATVADVLQRLPVVVASHQAGHAGLQAAEPADHTRYGAMAACGTLCPSRHWGYMVAHECLGTLLIVDLTDPLMDANAANAIFTVCVCGMWMLS